MHMSRGKHVWFRYRGCEACVITFTRFPHVCSARCACNEVVLPLPSICLSLTVQSATLECGPGHQRTECSKGIIADMCASSV